METNKVTQESYNESLKLRASKSKLSPIPDPNWRCEEEFASGEWVFYNLAYVANM